MVDLALNLKPRVGMDLPPGHAAPASFKRLVNECHISARNTSCGLPWLMTLCGQSRSEMATARVCQTSDKSAQLDFAVAIQAGGFLVDIFMDRGLNGRRKLWCRQHAIDDGCRQTGSFVVAFKDSPGGAASEAERLGLLVEGLKAQSDENVAEFPDFGRLSRLHICTTLTSSRAWRCWHYCWSHCMHGRGRIGTQPSSHTLGLLTGRPGSQASSLRAASYAFIMNCH